MESPMVEHGDKNNSVQAAASAAQVRHERGNKAFYDVLERLNPEIRETLRGYWKGQSDRAPFILPSLEMAQLLGHWTRWAGTIGFAFYFHARARPDISHYYRTRTCSRVSNGARKGILLTTCRRSSEDECP
jgi:hypothetical protein